MRLVPGQNLKKQFSFYVLLFLFICVIGWIYEVALAFLYGFGFVNRGFLFGPYLPVYGFGGLILFVSLGGVMEKRRYIKKIPVTPLIVFLLIVLITTVIEYLTGYVLELLFARRWWDYSHYSFNLNGRVCLNTSVRFGIGGMVVLYLLVPLFTRLVQKVPRKGRTVAAFLVAGVLLADFILTLTRL